MTIDEFIKSEHERVEQFKRFWTDGALKQGDEIFPLDMPLGEWDHQYLMFEPDFLGKSDEQSA